MLGTELIIFLTVFVTIQAILLGYVLHKTGLFPKWTVKRRIKKNFPIPINPNTNQRPCQYCGALPATKTQDGYYACASCKVLRLNQTA